MNVSADQSRRAQAGYAAIRCLPASVETVDDVKKGTGGRLQQRGTMRTGDGHEVARLLLRIPQASVGHVETMEYVARDEGRVAIVTYLAPRIEKERLDTIDHAMTTLRFER